MREVMKMEQGENNGGKSRSRLLRELKIRNFLVNFFFFAILAGALVWACGHFWKYLRYDITYDASIDQYISPVNIRVSGYISEVRFREHQSVRKGDTLLVLDNREYRIKEKEAMAALMDAEGSLDVLNAGIEIARSSIEVQEANIREAKAKLWQYRQDYERYERLLSEESVARHQFEQVQSDYEAAQARYDALVRQKSTLELQYTEMLKRQTGAKANIERMEADLDLARLNLSYSVLLAPFDGYTGRRTLEPGQYVQGGQTVTYMVRNMDKWVTANYREKQISGIYIGQDVRIRVDAIPDRVFMGKVTAISEATGSRYSLVPTDNSAGNFVKVQQRIPVRIEFCDVSDEDMAQMRAGMMVVTEAVKRRR